MKLPISILSIFLGFSAILSAQTQNFLKIEGPEILGESQTNGYQNQLNVIAYQLSASKYVQIGTDPRNDNLGPTEFAPLTLTAFVDAKAMPKIVNSTALGTKHDIITLTSARTSGNGLVVFSTIVLEEAFFINVSLAGTSGDVPVYDFSVEYAKITITTNVIDPTTGLPTGQVGMIYNRRTGLAE